MKRVDIKAMTEAMRTMKAICEKYHGAGCSGCPANGKGKPCHSGDISCCAPHRWWGIELEEVKDDDK
jgi:hypothetical protein